jgi:hypothetical protein
MRLRNSLYNELIKGEGNSQEAIKKTTEAVYKLEEAYRAYWAAILKPESVQKSQGQAQFEQRDKGLAALGIPSEEEIIGDIPPTISALGQFYMQEKELAQAAANTTKRTYQDRLLALENMLATGIISQEEYTARSKELHREELNSKLSALTAGLDGMAQLFGEQTKLGKAAAVASAIIGTYQAATLALTNPPYPPWSNVYAAAAIATGLGNVRRILATKTPAANVRISKYARGIIGVDGPGSETSDSITAQISKGETVLTAKATKVFAPVLADMERAVGNRPNMQLKNRRFASGYIGQQFAPRTDVSNDYEKVIRRTVEAIGNIPVVVSESDITGTQATVRKIKVTGDML